MSVNQLQQRLESAVDDLGLDIDVSSVEDVAVDPPEIEELDDGTDKLSAEMNILQPVEAGNGKASNIVLRGMKNGDQFEIKIRKRPICPSCKTVTGGQEFSNKLHGRCVECKTRTCEICAGRCAACDTVLCQEHRYGYGPHQEAYCWDCLQDVYEEVEFNRRLQAWEMQFKAWQEQVQQVRQLEEAELQKEFEMKKERMKNRLEREKVEMKQERQLEQTRIQEETKKEKIRKEDGRKRMQRKLDHEEDMRRMDLDEQRLEKEWEQQDWEIEKARSQLEFERDEHRWEKADKMMEMVEGMIELQDEYKDEDSGVVEVDSQIGRSAQKLPDI